MQRRILLLWFSFLITATVVAISPARAIDPETLDEKPSKLAFSYDRPIRLRVPNEPSSDHDLNKILDLGPLRESALSTLSAAGPIKLEASYNEAMSLEDALTYALRYNLPIRISKESYNYQKYRYYGTLAALAPSFSLSWNLTRSSILPPDSTISNARVYQATVRYPIFQGGSNVYGALAQYYREKGWRHAYSASINDALLDVYKKYTNLVLNDCILQIRANSLQVSEAQLNMNNALYEAGTGTQFAIMQSRTQLALDRQALLQQQQETRNSAIQLAYALNLPLGVNLVPFERNVGEKALWDVKNLRINDLIDMALVNRPELRQYELFRLAAARNVQVAAAPLYPAVSFFTSFAHASTTSNSTNSSATSSSSSSSSSSSASGDTATAGVFSGLTNTNQAGFILSWSIPNMALGNLANIVSARALSRQAMSQANQELLKVNQQVRTALISAVTARALIDAAAYSASSAGDALRLANMRVRTGLGTNLELIQAQRDYINALVNQAKAITQSNQAQAQLLHDTGLISVDSLLTGYKDVAPSRTDKRRKP